MRRHAVVVAEYSLNCDCFILFVGIVMLYIFGAVSFTCTQLTANNHISIFKPDFHAPLEGVRKEKREKRGFCADIKKHQASRVVVVLVVVVVVVVNIMPGCYYWCKPIINFFWIIEIF
jgi:hypothetical protein